VSPSIHIPVQLSSGCFIFTMFIVYLKAISHQPSAVSTQPTAKSFHFLLCPPGHGCYYAFFLSKINEFCVDKRNKYPI